MKLRSLLVVLLFISPVFSYSQFIHKIKADSVLITNDSCNAELNLENSTKDTLGFLYNKGKGRTEFRKGLIKINDSLYIIGSDTLNIAKGASGNYIQNQTAALQASGSGFFIEKGIFGQSTANGTTKSKLTIDPTSPTYLMSVGLGNSTNPNKLSHGVMTMDLTSVNTTGMKLFNIAGTPNTGIIPFYVNVTDNHMTSSATGFDLSYLRTAAGVNYPTYGFKTTVDSYAGTGYAYYANATATGGGTAYAFYAPAGRNYFADNVLIGTTTNISSSKLTVASTTQGFLKPRMTTTQRDAIASPVAGLEIYNTTTNTTDHYNGTDWISGNYILNQNMVAQPANAWINGLFTSGKLLVNSSSFFDAANTAEIYGNVFLGSGTVSWNNRILTMNANSSNGALVLNAQGTAPAFAISHSRFNGSMLTLGNTASNSTPGFRFFQKNAANITTAGWPNTEGEFGAVYGINLNLAGSSTWSGNASYLSFGDFYPLNITSGVVRRTGVSSDPTNIIREVETLMLNKRLFYPGGISHGKIIIGSTTDDNVNILQVHGGVAINSTTNGFLKPRMTTTQRNAIASPVAGLSIYNTTLNTNDTYNGSEYFSFGNQIILPATNTAAGTTGNQTINKASGTVNIAASGTTVTVTNSLVSANSIVIATIRTNDATAYVKNVVPAAGSFTINLGAAATNEVSIGFVVFN
ncbi:hypothetical protein [Terrimonas alba]|uniref:hypothetical protein n=1 Tax=Terrimonas alba TaxID=3349636 RepID=UPI0035F2386B